MPISLETGRNEKGQFASKQAILDTANGALAKYQQQLDKAKTQIDRLTQSQSKMGHNALKMYIAQGKQLKTQMSAMVKQQRLSTQMSKTTIKQLQSQQKAFQRLANEKVKAMRAATAHVPSAPKSPTGKGSGDGGGFSLGLGPLGGFLTVAALTASAKALGSYITDLARTRDYAQALAGSFRDVNQVLPHKRDAELFSKFATQGFSNRFAGPQEIQGLQAIRDALQQKLGDEMGADITLKLTDALKGSRTELSQFLAMASQDVPRALATFQSANIEDFSTALAAVNQRQSELSKTAYTLEQAWRDVTDSFEGLVTEFVKANGGDLRHVIHDFAQGFVDGINWAKQFAAELKPVFTFVLDGFKSIQQAWDFWSGKDFTKAANTQIAAQQSDAIGIRNKYLLRQAEAAKASGDTARQQALVAEIKSNIQKQNDLISGGKAQWSPQAPVMQLPEAFHKATMGARDTGSAIDNAISKTKEWWANLKHVLTPIQSAKINIDRIGESLEINDAMVRATQSRIAAAESSPMGFASLYQEQIRGAEQLQEKLGLIDKQYEQQQRIIQENARMGRQSKDDQIKLLNLEVQRNETIAARNNLLKAQTTGYLDAVQAQAMGAGAFEKIIITQENNMGAALSRGMIRANPYLGSVGAPSGVTPFRFSNNMSNNFSGAATYSKQLQDYWGSQGAAAPGVLSTPLAPMSATTTGILADTMSRPQPPERRPRASTTTTSNNPGHDAAQKMATALDAATRAAYDLARGQGDTMTPTGRGYRDDVQAIQ